MRHSRSSERSVRIRLYVVVAAMAAAAAACSGPEPTGDASLVVEIAGSSVSLENQTGTSLSKGEIAIIPAGISRPYIMNFSYMSSGQKKSFPLNSFRMSDGTPFRQDVATGRSVRVTATDVSGKAYTREVPFE